jgi:hypothetical protein
MENIKKMIFLNKLNIIYYYNPLLNYCIGFMTDDRREISEFCIGNIPGSTKFNNL